MAANDWGARIWDAAGTLVFDTADYSGRYVDSITINGTGYGSVTVPDKPAASDLWIKTDFYNVSPDQIAQALVTITGPSSFSHDLQYVSPGCVTVIHYGWR